MDGNGTDPNGKSIYVATNSPPAPQFWIWEIEPKCDTQGGDCTAGDFCAGEALGSAYMRIRVQGIAQPGIPTQENPNPPPVPAPPPPGTSTSLFSDLPPGTAIGQPYTGWINFGSGCISSPDIPLPPTPDEVYQVLTTLPIPGLGFSFQPPDVGLVNLPEIFYTTEATDAQFTFDIRGFAVILDADVAQFNWYPGTPDMLTSQGPGLPYPNEYVTYDYPDRGAYTATLEAIWQATYTVDGGPAQPVPGTVPTVGPSQTITIREARPVLTDPYN